MTNDDGAAPSRGSVSLPHDDLASQWVGRRSPRAVLHTDAAAAGRTSRAVQTRIAAHLTAESESGAYIAEAAAAGELATLRAQLGGLLGFEADDLTFTESSSSALAQLIDAFPRLSAGNEVWAVRTEWGPNLAAFADGGLRVEWLDTDPSGVLDVESLKSRLRGRQPAAVHLVAAASHRALVQPIGAAARVCDLFDVPVIVDAAQALGQVQVEPGAAAVYGTGRKWMCGPRGVGYLAVRDPWQATLHPVAPAISAENWPAGGDRPVGRLGSREAFVAGRLGLATAVSEYLELGQDRIRERLRAIGVALRTALADLPGWQLRDAIDAPGAIVSLSPRDAGTDVPAAVAELLRRGVLTTSCPSYRAPGEMTGYLLRLSPHVETSTDDIAAIAQHFRELKGANR